MLVDVFIFCRNCAGEQMATFDLFTFWLQRFPIEPRETLIHCRRQIFGRPIQRVMASKGCEKFLLVFIFVRKVLNPGHEKKKGGDAVDGGGGKGEWG